MGRYAPAAVILAVSIATSVTAIVLGGPRTGYLPGIVISTIIVLTITWPYNPSQSTVWSAAALLAAYHLGGTLMVGNDVLATSLSGTGFSGTTEAFMCSGQSLWCF